MGASYSGSTFLSKRNNVGSIPTAPAKFSMQKLFPNEEVKIAKHFDIHQDWETPIPGFFIIAGRAALTSVADFTDEQAQEFIRLLVVLRRGMREKLGIQKVHLLQNENTEHNFHVWVLPRHGWMERFGTKTAAVRPIVDYAKEHMVDEGTIKEVKRMVQVMNRYMENM